MTQTRPRIDDDLAAEIQAHADLLSKEIGARISFNAAAVSLLRAGLRAARQARLDDQAAAQE